MPSVQQQGPTIALQAIASTQAQGSTTGSKRRQTTQQTQNITSAQAQSQTTSQGVAQPQAGTNRVANEGRGCVQWMQDTTFTFNILSITLAALAFAAAIAYGTKTIIQANIANHYGEQSRDIALWQACVSNPDNPQIENSKWCAAHAFSNFDSDFTERDIELSPKKYTLDVPSYIQLPPELETNYCQIVCAQRQQKVPAPYKKINGRWSLAQHMAILLGEAGTSGLIIHSLRHVLQRKYNTKDRTLSKENWHGSSYLAAEFIPTKHISISARVARLVVIFCPIVSLFVPLLLVVLMPARQPYKSLFVLLSVFFFTVALSVLWKTYGWHILLGTISYCAVITMFLGNLNKNINWIFLDYH